MLLSAMLQCPLVRVNASKLMVSFAAQQAQGSRQELAVRDAHVTSVLSSMLPLLAGHNARVFDLAFSPADSDRFATASEDGSAKVKPIGCSHFPHMVAYEIVPQTVFCCRFGSTVQSTCSIGRLPPFTATQMLSCV